MRGESRGRGQPEVQPALVADDLPERLGYRDALREPSDAAQLGGDASNLVSGAAVRCCLARVVRLGVVRGVAAHSLRGRVDVGVDISIDERVDLCLRSSQREPLDL